MHDNGMPLSALFHYKMSLILQEPKRREEIVIHYLLSAIAHISPSPHLPQWKRINWFRVPSEETSTSLVYLSL